MSTEEEGVLAYWFAASDVLPHGDGRRVVIGEKLRVDPPLKLCRRGLHGSEHPFDALRYAPGTLLYRTRHSGEILRDHDKLCSTERTTLAVIDATDLLRRFAREQALSVIHLWRAPEIVRRYLETGDESIRAAAWAAASAAWIAAATIPAASAAWIAAATIPAAIAAIAAWAAATAATTPAAAIATWDAAKDKFAAMVTEVLP